MDIPLEGALFHQPHGLAFLTSWERLLPFITASPQIHVNVRHLFNLLRPEELNYDFVPTSVRSNLTLPEMRRCLGIRSKDSLIGGGAEVQRRWLMMLFRS